MSYLPTHNHYHLLRMKEMGRVYWCHSLAAFGTSLAMIFVPIFLLKSHYSFAQILVYLILQQLLAILLQYPASLFMAVVRPHHLLALAIMWQAVFYMLLGSLPNYHWPLGMLALVWALNRSLQWTAFHYIFGSARAHKRAGRQIAGINALTILATTVAPAIGGIAATILGIGYVYFAAIILLLFAIVPMLNSADGPAPVKVTLPWLEIKKMRRDVVANMCSGIVIMAETNMWPMLVYFLVTSYAGIGLLSSMIAVSSVVVTLFVGRRQDLAGKRHFLGQGLTAYSLTNIGRALASSATQVFVLNLLAGIGRSLYVTPFMNKYYTNSDGNFRLGYITVMESAFSLGTMIYLAVLLALTTVFSTQIVLSSGLAIVAIVVLGVRAMR